MTTVKVVACVAGLVLFAGLVWNQEAGKDKTADVKKKAPATPKKPATHKVEKKAFKIERTVKGILSPAETAEISYQPQPMMQSGVQGPLAIRKIVVHGAAVKAGDELAVFDTAKISEVIDSVEVDQKVLQASIKVAEEELPLAEKAAPLELAAAETAKKLADEDLTYFLRTEKAQIEKMADVWVKFAKFRVESTEEELKQLEKMYKANDLTEDTERIMLKRQRFYLEISQIFYQASLIERDHLAKHVLPNREKALRETQARQELALEKTSKTQGPATLQKQIALAKLRHDLAKGQTRLEKLNKDRSAMIVRSPIDGLVYHGKFHHGHWTVSEAQESKLVVNGTVNLDDVFLTVVKPRPLVVQVSIEEKDVHLFKPGLPGTGRLLVQPERKLTARVSKVASLPTSPDKFAAQITLEFGKGDTALMPGMACTVKFVPYAKKDALAVPSKCVHEEDDKDVVYVFGAGGKEERRDVTTGRVEGDSTEILGGLREGDEVILDRDAKKTTEKGATP